MSFLKNLFKSQKEQPSPILTELPPGPAAKCLVLDELRNVLEHQFDAADGLDSKLKELLGAASLILALVTTLQITTSVEKIGWPYLIGLVIVLVLYVVLIVVILRGLRPMTYKAPIPSNWDEIAERFFDLDEDAALELLIANYLKCSQENNTPINKKAYKIRLASILLVLIVFVLIAMGLFGLSGDVAFPWQSPLPMPSLTP